jgi:coatomer subunit beta
MMHASALILGGDFYTATLLASALSKLVMRFAKVSSDATRTNALRAEVRMSTTWPPHAADHPCWQAMLVMASIVRVGQSTFVAHPIDEDSQERIMNCINTLSDLEVVAVAQGAFLDDTKAAYTKMLAAQEVRLAQCHWLCARGLTGGAEKGRGAEGGRGTEGGRGAGRRPAHFPPVQ